MKCCYDLIIVIINVKEACRFGEDIYDSETWIFMKCEKWTNFEKIDELWQNDDLRHDSFQMTVCSW
jgi:hypothetical protein